MSLQECADIKSSNHCYETFMYVENKRVASTYINVL